MFEKFSRQRGAIEMNATTWTLIGLGFFVVAVILYFSWAGQYLGGSLLGPDISPYLTRISWHEASEGGIGCLDNATEFCERVIQNPSGLELSRVLGYALVIQPRGDFREQFPTTTLYSCADRSRDLTRGYSVETDPAACRSIGPAYRIGFIFTNPAEGTVPLVKCQNDAGQVQLTNSIGACRLEGFSSPTVLGHVYQSGEELLTQQQSICQVAAQDCGKDSTLCTVLEPFCANFADVGAGDADDEVVLDDDTGSEDPPVEQSVLSEAQRSYLTTTFSSLNIDDPIIAAAASRFFAVSGGDVFIYQRLQPYVSAIFQTSYGPVSAAGISADFDLDNDGRFINTDAIAFYTVWRAVYQNIRPTPGPVTTPTPAASPTSTPKASPTSTPSGNTYQKLFVTNRRYNGRLDDGDNDRTVAGIDRAHGICQRTAEAAGLEGNWLALLSTPNSRGLDRVAGEVRSLLSNSQLVIAEDAEALNRITSAPTRLTYENGSTLSGTPRIWTGSNSAGDPHSTQNCGEWGNNTNQTSGAITNLRPNTRLFSNDFLGCNLSASLLCISSTAFSDAPQPTAIPAGQTVTVSPRESLTAINDGSCFRQGSDVWCWGAWGTSQLPFEQNQVIANGDEVLEVPTKRTGFASPITDVDGGGRASCVVANGAAVCWGENYAGQVGDGTAAPRTGWKSLSNRKPVVGAERDVLAVRVGGTHSCAIMRNGSVRCWGKNNHGQLGDGTTSQYRTSAVVVKGLAGPAVDVIPHGESTCAILQDGSVQCWGKWAEGDYGTGPVLMRSLTPIKIAGWNSGVTRMSGLCAIHDGRAECLKIDREKLADGQPGWSTAEPAVITTLTSGVTDISGGTALGCAVQNGAVKCWGRNEHSIFGEGYEEYRPGLGGTVTETPIQVKGLESGITEVELGSAHACALRNNEVVCWGWNGSYQFGTGERGTIENKGSLIPVATAPFR